MNYKNMLKRIQSHRYFVRRNTYHKRKTFDWDDCLSVDSINFNDIEFLFSFRLTRESFNLLIDELKDHKVFSK